MNLHSKTLDNKLSVINTALSTIDSATGSLTDALSELTGSNANVPSMMSDSLITVKRMKDLFDELESKVK